MLEGFDHDWTEALQRREAFYTNLPPAEYRFRVQAFDMNMPESVTEVAMAVEWRSHFYRNAWFFALCGGIVICGGLGVPVAFAPGAHTFPRRVGGTQPCGSRNARYRDPGLRQRLRIVGGGGGGGTGRHGTWPGASGFRAQAGASHGG